MFANVIYPISRRIFQLSYVRLPVCLYSVRLPHSQKPIPGEV